MKKVFSFLSIVLVTVCAMAQVSYDVIPLPRSIELSPKGEVFQLQQGAVVTYPGSNEVMASNAQLLAAFLQADAGFQVMPQADAKPAKKQIIPITLSLGLQSENHEAYQLTVGKKGIIIQGASEEGVFRGIETLRKAIGTEAGDIVELPYVTIKDEPRFPYRGVHLDCARHFFSVDFIKQYLDVMALHGCNNFHWHFTEDQGWRFEVKSMPELAKKGSIRKETVIGRNSGIYDGQEYGGYYTQQECREIVDYAAKRFINVIPEIDLPGHMLGALHVYPELGCTGGPYEVGHYWGVYTDVLCVGNPKVYEFVEGVLAEIMDIFPSEVIHIGGDETPTVKWEACPKCQALGLSKDKLQAHFTQKVFDYLTAHQRRALGWDEILDGCPQDAMIMSWRGSEPGAKAAELGHDVVMTPTSHVYFDYLQSKEAQFEPSRCGGFIPVEKVYSLEPAPDTLSVEAKKHILGTQANLWAEYLLTEGLVEYQALPRMSALSEVQWTQPELKNYDAFKERLTRFTKLFEFYNYKYAKHLWPERQLPSRWQF